jgi:hypothetical protein
MDSPAFRLRPCVIGGQTAPDDCSVVTEDGETVGRIYRVDGARIESWAWFAHIPGAAANGRALSLDEAKKAFRAAWDRQPE